MDEARIRRDCAEADAVAVAALAEDVVPPSAQVDRLRDAVRGHLWLLVEVVWKQYADVPDGTMRELVTRTVALAEDFLGQAPLGSVHDLLVPPGLVRLLLLMHTEPEVFGAWQEALERADGKEEAGAV